MATVKYDASAEIPVTHEMDVVVIGGGPGGIGAAVMAARSGAKTLLVERYGSLGGMASFGEVHPFMGNHLDGTPLDQPVYTEWLARMKEYWPREGRDLQISKDVVMLAAEDLVLEAGAEILYHHSLADTIVEDGAISSAVLFSKSGTTAVKAKMFIDCSGDGDLAARAGCEFEIGGPSGHCQPMTTCFKLSHVERPAGEDARRDLRGKLTAIWKEAQESGELECKRENCLVFDWLDDNVLHFNTTRVIHKSGVDGIQLSEAEQEARKQIRQILKIFRDRAPGFENCQIHSIAHHIGIRETRRIKGISYLTRADFERQAKFPDAICRCRYPIDIHNPDGSGTEIVGMPEGDWYEIPYGCIVAKGISNLLVGGRPISVDHAVHSSMRVMPPACSIGQAAGMAASMAITENCTPAELDGVQLRKNLVKAGARLGEEAVVSS